VCAGGRGRGKPGFCNLLNIWKKKKIKIKKGNIPNINTKNKLLKIYFEYSGEFSKNIRNQFKSKFVILVTIFD
jgi:hypothetical protein